MSSTSIVAIIALSVAIIGVGVRLIAAFKPPKSERAKNALGIFGYGCIGVGLIILIAVAWSLPFTFQLPVRWNTTASQSALVSVPPAHPQITSFSNKSNPALKSYTLDFVSKLNALTQRCRQELGSVPDRYKGCLLQTLFEYHQIYAANASQLRTELRSRLQIEKPDVLLDNSKEMEITYRYANNNFALDDIAKDLQSMANNL